MSDPSRPWAPRPIAPAASGGRDETQTASSPSGQPPTDQAPSDETSLPPRKHKTTACETCRQKKLKCRGGPPCDYCVINGIDCQTDELSDMRRKGAMERKIEQLEDVERLLLDLVETLKKDNQNVRTCQLINLIRSNASLDEIRFFLEEHFSPEELERMPEVAETQNHLARIPKEESNARPRRRVMAIPRLADIPLYRVPAKPWTTVTDDDDLVSHLISMWLTWSHPWFRWVNRDLFIRDMQAGNLDCEFCSPFLVNAILAEMSLYSNYSEVFTVSGDMISRGDHFQEETLRLLEEEDQIRLPTVQGLITFFVRIAMTGKGRIAWMYLDMAIRAAKEYEATHPYRPTDEESVRITEDAINETLWGLFNLCCTVNLCTLKHVDMEPPQRPRPPVNHEKKSENWTPYPKQIDSMPGHLSCLFHRWCDLCCIMIIITRTFFDSEDRPSPSEMAVMGKNIERQLQGWYANLPNCLRVWETTVPHILTLHLFYHTVCAQLYGFLRSQANENHDSISMEENQSCRFATARRVATLFDLHRRQWGVERMHQSTIQCVAVSCLSLLEGLESPENSRAFVSLCTVARDFGRHFALARGVLQVIQLVAQEMKVILPQDTRALLQTFDETSLAGEKPTEYNSLYLNAMDRLVQKEAGDDEVNDEKHQPYWDYS